MWTGSAVPAGEDPRWRGLLVVDAADFFLPSCEQARRIRLQNSTIIVIRVREKRIAYACAQRESIIMEVCMNKLKDRKISGFFFFFLFWSADLKLVY